MKMKTGDYKVITLEHPEMGFLTEFFTPRKDFRALAHMALTIADDLERGYKIVSILRVDKETYLNLKINNVVDDYTYQDQTERDIRASYYRGEVSLKVMKETIFQCESYKGTCLRRLDILLGRLEREDFECHNELAIELYNMYLSPLLLAHI